MPKRTQIICLHEGERNKEGKLYSIDPIFANAFFKAYKPNWVRGGLRSVLCGGKTRLLERFPEELKLCGLQGADTTLIVFADVDDDHRDCDELKARYHSKAKKFGLPDELFEKVVFIFPKDRIENWIEFLNTGFTDENKEGRRVEPSVAVDAAKKLARLCRHPNEGGTPFPPSLEWSCKNWNALIERMR